MTSLTSRFVDRDRIAGGLIWMLLGDAIAMPYHFMRSAELPPVEWIVSEKSPPPGRLRQSATALSALCLLESLLDTGRLDPHDFQERLARLDADQPDGRNVVDCAVRKVRPIEAGWRRIVLSAVDSI